MKIIGHRGARGLAPENTIASLKKSLEYHVDMVEFDVRVTKDNIPVLQHDSYISDSNGDRHIVAESTFKELHGHKPNLITLVEALEIIGNKTRLYTEVKPKVKTGPVIAVLEEYLMKPNWSASQFLLASFSQKVLVELHEALPTIDTLVLENWSGMKATHRARQLGTHYICMNQRWLWRGFIAPIANRGWKLCAYTVNNPVKAKRWQRYGLYGVVTDYPDLFKK